MKMFNFKLVQFSIHSMFIYLILQLKIIYVIRVETFQTYNTLNRFIYE